MKPNKILTLTTMCRPIRIQQLRDTMSMLLTAIGANHLYDTVLSIRNYFYDWCYHPLPPDTKLL